MALFDPIIEKIANYTLTYEAQEASLQEAKTCFFDSLACAFLALEHKKVKDFCNISYIKDSSGPVRVIGTDIKTNPVDAAFLNGSLIRWLDFNDTWLAKEWGHPSDNLGAIISLADYLNVKGIKEYSFKEILNFMVIAHEIQGCLAIENSLNRQGLDHVALVKVASASVASRMMSQDPNKLRAAISNAFIDGQSLRTYRHFPNTGARKSWAAGDASAKALKQVFISEVSDENYPTAISEKNWGFNDVLMGDSPLTLERDLSSYVMDNILYKVSFPAEFHAQTAAEAALKLNIQLSDKLEEIDKIIIETQEPGMRIISKEGPLTNYADRDHCIEYIVVWCLLNGILDSDSYSDDSASDPRIDALREKTTTLENKKYTEIYYDLNHRAIPNKVIVKLNSGEEFEEEILYPLGHKKRREEATSFLREKFINSMDNIDLDKDKLIDFYDIDDLDSINIYKILENITK